MPAKHVASGTLELMATRVAVHFNAWLESEMPLRVEQVLPTTPVVIQRTSGSNIFNVLENIAPGLAWADLLRFAEHLGFVIVALAGDNAHGHQ